MIAPQVAPENFNISPEAPEEGPFVASEASRLFQGPVHLDSALPPEFARLVVERAISPVRSVPSKLTVEGKTRSVYLELALRLDDAASSFRLISDEGESVKLVLESDADKGTSFKLDINYAGLPISKALTYARFFRALSWQEGSLFLSRAETSEERFKLAELPLPIDSSMEKAGEDKLRFLEALDEVTMATGAEFIHPSQIEDDDLQALNHVLRAIRGGWIALSVTDFTTPMGPEGVQNVLHMVQEDGALGMDSSSERVRVFDTWVDLGPSRRYVSHVCLTARSEMRKWLASGPKLDDTFDIRWEPIDEARVHVFYRDWPKPSLAAINEDIYAFEQEIGKSSDDFRRAWESGEAWARKVQDGDVWRTLLDAKHHIEHGT